MTTESKALIYSVHLHKAPLLIRLKLAFHLILAIPIQIILNDTSVPLRCGSRLVKEIEL